MHIQIPYQHLRALELHVECQFKNHVFESKLQSKIKSITEISLSLPAQLA